MNDTTILWFLLTPFVISMLAFAARGLGAAAHRALEALHLVGISLVLILALILVGSVLAHESLYALGEWLHVDALAAIFVLIIGVIGFLTGLYSIGYMRHDLESGQVDTKKLSTYYGFFHLFLFTMILTVTSNNLVLMWVAIEATTLGSAFLVGLYGHKSSLEAMWKYVLICTVGVAFALYGTILVYSNSFNVLQNAEHAMMWTEIFKQAKSLDPMIMKLALAFVLIGFGTKAGIFPMHAWLPDAHSEAPSPISAQLSGVLLKCALFVIIRYYVIVVQSVGPSFPQTLFLFFGILSVGAAAFFIFAQHDIKRKLAYHSVEHVGLILTGLGVGGPIGMFAALLHTMTHGVTKALMFCTSGNILMKYGTRDSGAIKGMLTIAPISAVLWVSGALALAGAPPFGIFVSELQIIQGGVTQDKLWLMAVVLLFTVIVFASLLELIGDTVFGPAPQTTKKGDVGWLTLLPIAVLLVVMVGLGLYMPSPLFKLLSGAVKIVLAGS